MSCCRYLYFTLIVYLFGFNKLSAQTTFSPEQPDSLYGIKTYFKNEVGGNAHLYTGKEFTGYVRNAKGHPFFLSDQMQNGNIFYDGSLYENVPLLFDAVNQQVVINRYNQNFKISLLSEKVKYFTIVGHRFEHITIKVVTGLYDVVFDGNAKLLARRVKNVVKSLKAEDLPSINESDEFYIMKNNSLYAVDGKNSLLKVFEDKKDLVKAYIRKNNFNFKKNREKELTQVSAYYSTLTN